MDKKVKIMTDSGSDLPKEIVEQFDIEVLPLRVILNEVEYLDGVTISTEELYKNMLDGAVYKTAQYPLDAFLTRFEELAKENIPTFYLAFSSELSGTYNTAVIALEETKEKYPDCQIEIIDTKCASLGFGMVVYYAAQMAESGMPMDEIIEKTKYNAKHMQHVFTVENLVYLCRGGRVSKTAAFVADSLNIRPILDVEDGKLIPIKKERGYKRLYEKMISIIGERGYELNKQIIGISHGGDIEKAEMFREMMREKFGCENFYMSVIGGAIGSHSGPGTLAIFFLDDKQI